MHHTCDAPSHGARRRRGLRTIAPSTHVGSHLKNVLVSTLASRQGGTEDALDIG